MHYVLVNNILFIISHTCVPAHVSCNCLKECVIITNSLKQFVGTCITTSNALTLKWVIYLILHSFPKAARRNPANPK